MRSSWRAVIFCTLYLTAFAAISWASVRGKCATFDEPYHAVGGWVQLWRHDFRIDPEDGPLFHAWAALADGPAAVHADFNSQQWRDILANRQDQWTWFVRMLYQTPGNNADAFVMRQRAMMLIAGVGLGVVIGIWAGRIGGGIAAMTATTLFCLDPNFIGHASLVKNDLAFSAAMLATAIALWRAGRRLTVASILCIGVLCGIGLTIKFSGILLLPIVFALLACRAVLPVPWPTFLGELKSITKRLIAAATVTLLAGFLCYGCVWAAYGFRFAPTPAPTARLNMDSIEELAARAQIMLRSGNANPTNRQLQSEPPAATIRICNWLQMHRLLPQAFINGFVYTYQSALLRDGYLLQQIYIKGHWYYFPLAMLFKTPVATMAAGALFFIVGLRLFFRDFSMGRLWTALCLLVPPGIYLASAMSSNVNLGLRHVFPVYGFGFVGCGVIAAKAWRQWPQKRQLMGAIAAGLALMLAIETISAFPDYIAFFNFAAGGERGGIKLLGDSNLDWGQDLKLLASWQKTHADGPLYLSYFGEVDPAYYGIKYVNLPGGYSYGPKKQWPTGPGYLAVSATNLQGIWLQPQLYERFYAQLWKFRPIEVLGGTIYVYRFPPG